MAEKIVSPGVFTQENDLSFLPQGISEIGAAIVGPTEKGPAFVPTIVESYNDFEQIFGTSTSVSYVPYTVKEYLRSAGVVTIVRVLDVGGYLVTPLVLSFGAPGSRKTTTVIHPSNNASNQTSTAAGNFTFPTGENAYLGGGGFPTGSFKSGSGQAGESSTYTSDAGTMSFILTGSAGESGGTLITASFDVQKNTYIENIFDETPASSKAGYLYVNFQQHHSSSYTAGTTSASFNDSTEFDFVLGSGNDASPAYQQALTPNITSQYQDGTNTSNLFQVATRAHGTSTNRAYKIAISDVKFASQVPGSDYGTFTLSVRKYNDTDKAPSVLESFAGLTLNPSSPNFICRVIGDQDMFIDGDGKLIISGDYPNRSRYIYIKPATGLNEGGVAKSLVPYGFAAVEEPIPSGLDNCPIADYKYAQEDDGKTYQSYAYYGFNFDNIDTANDNINYLMPMPDSNGAGDNVAFNLSAVFVHPSHSTTAQASASLSGSGTPVNARKFVIPFQGGFDGTNPGNKKKAAQEIVNTNTFGFDCSTATAKGTLSYKKALNAISNADEYDINMVVTPGIISRLHPTVTQKAIDVCTSRGDAFYIMDTSAINDGTPDTIDSISTVTGEAENWDTNYAATYYPWVKIRDVALNKFVWVPPSVVLPGVFSFNDKVGQEWFAPAGLNRGGLTTVNDVYTRLTHAERDDLYDGRVNPIAVFPGQGVTVFGQKTLQVKASALDRINVRRLLINLKKFIASSARFLVFENNTTQTRNRFLGIVNPYLETVQQNQGLYAFRVVMDETNNTPDLIDRNIMKGEIFLQPAKAAEFIVVDFNILPTGASFGD
jgi:hypothetical protein